MNNKLYFSIALIAITFLFFIGCEREDSERIEFGAILSLTGEAASYGVMMKNGMDIAVDEVNEAGGINGQTIRVRYEDSQFIPRNAISAAQKLIEVDNVKVLTGITGSKNALAVAPIANRNRVVVIDALSSSPVLTEEGGPFYFRVMPSDSYSGSYAAEWAIEEDWNKGVIVYANDDWGRSIKEVTRNQFEQLGGNILLEEGIATGGREFRTTIQKIRNNSPDVIFLFMYAPEAGPFVKQVKENIGEVNFIGSDNLSADEFLRVGRDIVEGVRFVLPSEGYGEVYENFREEYQSRFGEEPSINSIKSYDAVRLAAYAVSQVGYDAENIRDFLLNDLDDYYGASGKIEFDQNGDIKNPVYNKMIYREGRYISLLAE